MKELCGECEVIYSNADQDAAKQQNQAEAALTNGAQVLVLDPVDSASAAAIVARAKQSKIPVISYDRLITGADVDYYISFDNEKVGKLQGQALVEKLKADGKDERHHRDDQRRAHRQQRQALQGRRAQRHRRQRPDDRRRVRHAGLEPGQGPAADGAGHHLHRQGQDRRRVRANDGTAGGAIAAMKAAGIKPLPPVTGQDAELAGIQRIIAGEQFMTVYKAIKPEAEMAAELAVALARGPAARPAGKVNAKVNNGKQDVPSMLLEPVAVTKDNVKTTVVADGFWKARTSCAPASYKDACTAAQIQ